MRGEVEHRMAEWPRGAGEMAAQIRAFDWATTALGPIDGWPASLRTAVDLVLDSPVVAILLWGEDCIQIYNDQWRERMGDKHPAALGQATHACFPEIAATMAPIYDRVLQGEAVVLQDSLLPVRRYGEVRDAWWNVHYLPVREESGRVGGILCIVTETTESILARRTHEAHLREREEDLARVQRMGRVAGVDIDVAGGMRSWRSPEYLRLHGLGESARAETHAEWVARLHPDDREQAERTFFEALSGGASDYQSEYRIIRPSDGAVRWIQVRADIERDASGKALRLVGAHLDVTEQKEIQDALRETGSKTRAADRLGIPRQSLQKMMKRLALSGGED